MTATRSRVSEGAPTSFPRGRDDEDRQREPRAEQPPSSKGLRTRTRLLQAAKVVFERDGFLGARIVDIAETAHLAPASFYHYFVSKEQIFREVALAQEARLTSMNDEAPTITSSADSWQRIGRDARRYLERYREEAALMGVIEQVSRYDDQVNAARMNTMAHYAGRAEAAIVFMQQEGVVDNRLDPGIVADAFGAMLGRFAELWLVQGYRDYEFHETVEQLSMLCANALGLPDRREGRGAATP
jgi:AcrR family transcriptional regulator